MPSRCDRRGGRSVRIDRRRGEAATDVSHTWVLRAVIAAQGAARPGTNGAHSIVGGSDVILFRLSGPKPRPVSETDRSVKRRQVVAVEVLGRSDADPVEITLVVVAVRLNGSDDLTRFRIEDGESGVNAGRGMGVTGLR